jgi:hypothetical protein
VWTASSQHRSTALAPASSLSSGPPEGERAATSSPATTGRRRPLSRSLKRGAAGHGRSDPGRGALAQAAARHHLCVVLLGRWAPPRTAWPRRDGTAVLGSRRALRPGEGEGTNQTTESIPVGQVARSTRPAPGRRWRPSVPRREVGWSPSLSSSSRNGDREESLPSASDLGRGRTSRRRGHQPHGSSTRAHTTRACLTSFINI